ncbi:MAG: WecB/TagA/CpsF family glycosyltransferase, partial [Desulfocucumaceae bacterium]
IGQPVPERVTGIDLMLRLLEYSAGKGWRVFFLGSAPGVAEAAAEKAVGMFSGLQVVGTHHGYFSFNESDEVVSKIVSSSPQLLLVATGSPSQEIWIDDNLKALGAVVAVGVGGSLDVLSGNIRRAPEWFIRRNLEWLGRLTQEPSRLRRMLVLPKFAFLVTVKYKIGKKLNRK